MGKWTPLVLMAGGLAILMGTLLGINFPMGEGQKLTSNTPGDKASKVLPANINVNSSTPSNNRSNANTSGNRNNVTQEDFNTNDNASDTSNEERGNVSQEDRRSTSRTNVAQNNPTNESFSSSDNNNTSDTAREVQSTTTSPSTRNREPIRALW